MAMRAKERYSLHNHHLISLFLFLFCLAQDLQLPVTLVGVGKDRLGGVNGLGSDAGGGLSGLLDDALLGLFGGLLDNGRLGDGLLLGGLDAFDGEELGLEDCR